MLREMEAFLNTCGVTVNTWIPSAGVAALGACACGSAESGEADSLGKKDEGAVWN